MSPEDINTKIEGNRIDRNPEWKYGFFMGGKRTNIRHKYNLEIV